LTDRDSYLSTFDLELLTAHAAIRHFRYFCEGHAFQLWTDHKPLVTALSCVSAPISKWQQRHSAFISESNVQILYLPGLTNVVGDFCPDHPPRRSHLELSPQRQQQIPLTSKPSLLSKIIARKHSACSAVHPSKLF
jgi:hypothetical protein